MNGDAFGDPGAVTCRWCGEGKRRHVGALICGVCDLIEAKAEAGGE
ncbi:MAG TPA: hypothetical protein VFJ14_11325 [Nocardioidaceae bacterium]|nr:hypothetical protein [Nocardioidaceae bacterium]